MPRIPIGLASFATLAGKVTKGSAVRILWHLLLIVLGAFVIIYAIAASSSYITYFVIGVILTFSLGWFLRQSLADLWNMNFLYWKP